MNIKKKVNTLNNGNVPAQNQIKRGLKAKQLHLKKQKQTWLLIEFENTVVINT